MTLDPDTGNRPGQLPDTGNRPPLSTGKSPNDSYGQMPDTAIMSKAVEILAERVRARLAALDISAAAASLAATEKPDLIRDIERGRMPNPSRLSSLAQVLGVSTDWLLGHDSGDGLPPAPPNVRYEAPRPVTTNVSDPERPFRAMEHPRNMPVLGSALGTPVLFDGFDVPVEAQLVEMGEVIDYVRRPPGVAHLTEAYALYIAGDSQSPRFNPGDLIYINPRRRAAIGDDVVVQITNGDGTVVTALIKRLVKRTPSAIVLEQFNPPLIFEVPINRVQAEHRVMTMLDLLGI
jgi:phage repressor protein C with HTH and peptisase S24 domain